MAIDEKAPSEKRPIPFHLGPQIPAGASIVSVQAYVSWEKAGFTTTLAAPCSAEAATLTLADNPGKGALLVVDPGSPTSEETFKVVSIAGNVATLSHTAELAHSGGATVNYEPGFTDRMLIDDTPVNVGTDVTVWVQFGAHGHPDGNTYHISVLCPLSDGTVAEEQRDLKVIEHAPELTKEMEVDVIGNIEFGFDDPVSLAGSNLLSAIAWASRDVSIGTTLAAPVTQGAATISLTADPGVGAMLTLNPTGLKQEKLKVTSRSGAGPFICVTNPTPDFDHTNGEPLTYEPGVSTRLLASTTATIVGATKARVRKQKGMAKQSYRVTVLGTFQGADAERAQASMWIDVVEK